MSTLHFNSSALSGLAPSDQLLFSQFGLGEEQVVPFRCVHHAFEHYAQMQPSATAVEHLGDSLTYAELDRKANALARQLRTMGVQPGTRVCLLVQRSIAMVIAILAVLKAGGAYVPLDGGIVTQSTLEYVLEDSEAALVIVLQEYAHRVSDISGTSALVLEEAIRVCDELEKDFSKPIDLSSPSDGVYVIYTSGLFNVHSTVST